MIYIYITCGQRLISRTQVVIPAEIILRGLASVVFVNLNISKMKPCKGVTDEIVSLKVHL